MRTATSACIDQRYEVRDTQIFLGQLVDEGLIQPDEIAATGGSYGGGMSMSLAALKDRMMMPDGTLVPWQSPDGIAMSLAVATPNIPWTELTYALAPNGSNLDYIADAGYTGRDRRHEGVLRPGPLAHRPQRSDQPDPTADILGWKALLDAGEHYDDDPAIAAMKTEINTYHSSYGIDHSEPPAPLLISSGFTDDLFPVNEATRYYNRTRAQYPNTPLSLFFGSFGHPRGQNQAITVTALSDLEDDWIDYYLKGTGTKPAFERHDLHPDLPERRTRRRARTRHPTGLRSRPARSASRGRRGRRRSPPTAATPPSARRSTRSRSSNACATAAGAQGAGHRQLRVPARPGRRLHGAWARRRSSPDFNARRGDELAGRRPPRRRLRPTGRRRRSSSAASGARTNSGTQVFQLFANGWKVEEGHVLRLELLPRDAASATPGGFLTNYGRPSNGQER